MPSPSFSVPPGTSPRAILRRLYADDDAHGYDDPSPGDEARVRATRSSSTYGEIMPAATEALVQALALGEDDVFYDLGSGIGKVVIQVALTVPLARCIGLELVGPRHRIATRMLARVRSTGLLRAREVGFRRADFMRARIGDATCIYTCSTAFSTPFMDALAARLAARPPGLVWATTQDLDDNPWWTLERILRLDMSWRRRSKVHVYRLTRRRWR